MGKKNKKKEKQTASSKEPQQPTDGTDEAGSTSSTQVEQPPVQLSTPDPLAGTTAHVDPCLSTAFSTAPPAGRDTTLDDVTPESPPPGHQRINTKCPSDGETTPTANADPFGIQSPAEKVTESPKAEDGSNEGGSPNQTPISPALSTTSLEVVDSSIFVHHPQESSSPNKTNAINERNAKRSFRLSQGVSSGSYQSPMVGKRPVGGDNTSFSSQASHWATAGSGSGMGYSRYVQPDGEDDDVVVFMEEFEVAIHIYDLSAGLVGKFSQEITGTEGVEGMLHSALVVYGFEYFFEGGIQRTPAGLTRFGANFRKEVVTVTDVTIDVFEAWVQEATKEQFQLYHYKTIEHNCHHFVDTAIRFLTDEKVGAPPFLIENTKILAESPVGQVSIPLFDRITGGYQYILSKQIATHQRQRKHRVARLNFAMESAAALEEPPSTIFTYRGHDVEASVMQILTKHEDMTDGFSISSEEKRTIIRIAKLMGANQVFLDPTDVRVMIYVLVQSLEQRENWGLAPMLDAWRTLSINTSFVGTAGYEKRLNFKLLLILKDFYILPVSCKLSVLRLCCNLCASPHGAILLTDARRIGRVVSAIGGALMDTAQEMVLHCGASLACNIIIASTILCKGSFDRELRKRKNGKENPLRRLITLIVYHVNITGSEDVRVRLLLAVFHFCLAGRFSCRVVGRQRVQLLWRTVYDRCASEEARELLRMIQYLVFNMESDGSESDKLSDLDTSDEETDTDDEGEISSATEESEQS